MPEGYVGYTEATTPRRIVVPASTAARLILKLHDSPHRPPQFVMGARSTFFAPEGACAPSYLELRLAPLEAYTVLGLPIDQLGDQIVDLSDVLDAPNRWLGDQLREAPTWRRRYTLLDRFLLQRVDRGPRPSPEVRQAWWRLAATGGSVPIGQIAREVGWSHKHLITRFRQQIGLAPKTAAQVVRFDRMWRAMDTHPAPDWGRLAADAGYADQAHLIRDFRRYTGTTPAALLARSSDGVGRNGHEVNSVQEPSKAPR